MTRRDGSREKKRMGPQGALSALDTKMATVITVVRKLGVVLAKAHEACEKDMLDAGYHETASVLRDELKPLIDALIHFDVARETQFDAWEDPTDGP